MTVARALGIAVASAHVSEVRLTTGLSGYHHILALEITDDVQGLLWKGEATWASGQLELRNDLTPALQLLFSQLPHKGNVHPTVRAVRSEKQENFYRLLFADRWFSCPALPYRIAFERTKTEVNYLIKGSAARGIEDGRASAAYLDLIQTAEYALPTGGHDYSDPLDRRIWSNTQLGGQYVLQPGGVVANVVIKLKGTTEGYVIDKCFVATDEQYAEFVTSLDRWQAALLKYYDLYE